jgi:hypothetical protein
MPPKLESASIQVVVLADQIVVEGHGYLLLSARRPGLAF